MAASPTRNAHYDIGPPKTPIKRASAKKRRAYPTPVEEHLSRYYAEAERDSPPRGRSRMPAARPRVSVEFVRTSPRPSARSPSRPRPSRRLHAEEIPMRLEAYHCDASNSEDERPVFVLPPFVATTSVAYTNPESRYYRPSYASWSDTMRQNGPGPIQAGFEVAHFQQLHYELHLQQTSINFANHSAIASSSSFSSSLRDSTDSSAPSSPVFSLAGEEEEFRFSRSSISPTSDESPFTSHSSLDSPSFSDEEFEDLQEFFRTLNIRKTSVIPRDCEAMDALECAATSLRPCGPPMSNWWSH